jgi:YegS/Rv2252/BmrU family lipid kinase
VSPRVAVVAHHRKTFGDGLGALHDELARHRVTEPIWHEIEKSKQAPDAVRKALKEGAEIVFAWGGDGTVQRCADVLAGTDATLAILPAGTANLLAHNLGVPMDLAECVDVGLHGARRRIDVGRVNGETFCVMAGTGFDALMIRDADRGLKDKVGRLAYIWTGARHLDLPRTKVKIDVDGERWFKGPASCILFGNVSSVLGGVTAFDDARPDDGLLDLGVVTAEGPLQWARTLARTAFGHSERSPFVEVVRAEHTVDVRLERKLPYELDGGDRKPTKRLRVEVEHQALTVAVPASSLPGPSA